MIRISKGTQDCWGIAINYNPDYRDVSFHLLKWYIAIGFEQKLIPFEEVLSEIEWTEEDSWYLMTDYLCCDICEDVLDDDEARIVLEPEDGNTDDPILVCEYCVNPDLKDE